MIRYILLGIIQGITEFLPVSSSGHLVVMQKVLGISGHELAVSVVLHLGTGLALIVFFFKDILNLRRDKKMLLFVVVVTLVTGIIGLSGRDFFTRLFSTPWIVVPAWILSGVVLILTKKIKAPSRKDLNIKDALILGFSQAAAIVPGISRSGVTISVLLFRKVDRATCFTFSFLASIPAVLGAAILETKDVGLALEGDFKLLFVGFICSFLSGILALKLLKIILLREVKFHYFGYYCIAMAIITLLFIK